MIILFVGCRVDAQQVVVERVFLPPEDGFDWIQLTSDEWLKGDLVSLFHDTLSFDSDKLGVLTIDWEDVRIFKASRAFELGFEDASTVSGVIRVDDDVVSVESVDAVLEFDRSDVVAITPFARREIDRWEADLGAGINARRGNSSTVEANLRAGFKRRSSRSRLTGDYLGSFNETEGIKIAESHRANLTYDRQIRGRLFWRVVGAQYLQDVFQNLRHQGKVESGLGYTLLRTDKSTWELSGGVGGSYIEYVSVAPDEEAFELSPSASIGTIFETELTSWIDFDVELRTTFLNEKSGRYQHHLLTTLSSDLVGDVDMDVTFVWDRVQQPQPREDGSIPERDDYRLIFGLSYEF